MQLHKRLTTEQARVILKAYGDGNLSVKEGLDLLGVKRTVFFDLRKRYLKSPETFSIEYKRHSRKRISRRVEKRIERAILDDRSLVDDPLIPVKSYNYSAIRDRLKRDGIHVSVPTIIHRAKQYGCYQPKKERQLHDREVITTAVGALIQHDASHHLWSPFAQEKWVLITSLDDYSRYLLYAKLVESESTWAHIEAVRELMMACGVPLQYYVDSLRVFRFVSHGDSIWIEQRMKTDDVNPQWKRCVQVAGSQVTHALSPEAKGKVERPYRWLQDRIVRTCALERIGIIDEAQEVLRMEVDRYNRHQVHSTTKEIPHIRFVRAGQEGKSLFRPFIIPAPYTHRDDVFCLQERRTTDGYRKISLWNQTIQIPRVHPYENVDIHIVPNKTHQTITLRIWWENRLVLNTAYPQSAFPKVRL